MFGGGAFQEEAMVSIEFQKGIMSLLVHFRNNRKARVAGA